MVRKSHIPRKERLVFLLALLLVLAIPLGLAQGYSGLRAPSGAARNPGIVEVADAVPGWQQVNSNGFGDPQTGEVTALETFNGYLYAGTHNPVSPGPTPIFDGGQIFRSLDGVSWNPVTQPGFSIPHDSAAPAILDLTIFNGYLYASTGRGGNPGQIWRSVNGSSWSPTISYGFGDEKNVDITALAVYGNKIYAGVTNSETGAQIWRSSTGDNAVGSWTKVAPGASMAATSITGFAGFNGALYAALESEGAAQIWRSSSGDLNTWATIISNGFGDSNTIFTGGMAVFAGFLYVGAGNSAGGAQLYRTDDGATWDPVTVSGLGAAGNLEVETVFAFDNQIYIGVKNSVTGMRLWRSPDGTLWERANLDGFGDSHNPGSNSSNASAGFGGHLYMGTSNVLDGGELWRMQQQYLYLPQLVR
jgi:hypothetical protein